MTTIPEFISLNYALPIAWSDRLGLINLHAYHHRLFEVAEAIVGAVACGIVISRGEGGAVTLSFLARAAFGPGFYQMRAELE